MHALEHPHPSRIGLLTLGAVVLAIVVLLLAAARLGGIGASSRAAASLSASSPQATARTSWPAAWPRYFNSNVFASPFHIAFPWTRVRGR